MDTLADLAGLIRQKIDVDNQIARIIGRPALLGHTGEYIAAHIFDIALESSAAAKGFDGRFRTGPLANRSVNIKWYTKQEGLLDLTPDALPDHYLVLSGPKAAAASSRGTVLPWLIRSVFLFDARALEAELRQRGVKLGVATSVIGRLWEAAEIYPQQRNNAIIVTAEQREALALFQPQS
jgi:hypothetical protein